MSETGKIYYLKGVAQYYAWGGSSFIPSLVPSSKAGDKPVAEYWLGAHDSASSIVIDAKQDELNKLIANDPEKLLGKKVAKDFGRLPYLLKLLDVKDMLSIQVHPSKKEAEKEFERENKEGIPINSPQRNYKDNNHKPELMVAMSAFWLLHGFKAEEELVYTLLNVVELRELLPVFNQSGYAGLYKYVMEMPQEEVNRILQPLINNITPLYNNGKLDRGDEDFWAARANQTFSQQGNIDRGIFSIYFFNLVNLKKGEGIFQNAGVPHAYLEGQNVEIMANSDNVLRGGLTPKHIDVKELLKHTKFEATTVNVLQGKKENNNELLFETPAPDFQLSVFELKKGEKASFISNTTEILLLTSGATHLDDGNGSLALKQSENISAVIFMGQSVTLLADENTTVFRASVPV